jgi:glycosyltransferase involved in cell wall biosynthesis
LPAGIHIEYKGEVMPNKVQHLFAEYHAMLFPTKGENFGHAIYECLSVGRPVIVSTETPWKELEKKCGGYDISLNNEDQFKKAIQTFLQMDQTEFEIRINGAHAIAIDYWRSNDVSSAYLQLFA